MFESLMNESSLKALYKFFLPQKSRPSYLLFFVTSRCEASCGHCFYWRNINRNETELTLKEIECFARILGPMVQITLTGGSPELRDDLPELALILARFCRPINMTLCSNGNEPNKLYKIVETILRRIPNFRLTLDISLDGLNGEHDKIRGVPGLFERAVQSFYALENLKKTYPGLRLGLGLCVSGLNEGTAVKTANWAMDNLPLDNLTPVLVRGEPRNPKAIHCNPDIFLQIAQEVKTRLLCRSFRGYAGFSEFINAKDIIQKELIGEIARSGHSPIRCSAARETVVVYPEGSVGGCELRKETLGNLRNVGMDLTRIWQNKRTKEFRNKIKSQKCVCWHQCFLSSSIVKSPRLWAKLFKTAWSLRNKYEH